MGKNRKSGRDTDGMFAPGNSGKPRVTGNKATQSALSLLDSQTEAFTQKAVDMDLDGDTVALRLCLERIAPPRRNSPMAFSLPAMNGAQDAAKATAAIIEAGSTGDLTPQDGAHVMAMIETYRRTLETSKLEARVKVIESDTQ